MDWFGSEGEERFKVAEETKNGAPPGSALSKSGKVHTIATSASESSSLGWVFLVPLKRTMKKGLNS